MISTCLRCASRRGGGAQHTVITPRPLQDTNNEQILQYENLNNPVAESALKSLEKRDMDIGQNWFANVPACSYCYTYRQSVSAKKEIYCKGPTFSLLSSLFGYNTPLPPAITAQS